MLNGAVYLFDRESASLRAITGEGLRQTDLTVSPGGRYLSYVRAGDLYLYDLVLAREERLTHDASDCVTNGLAEFVAQEEMHRFEGHWWSPDDARVVFARVDNSSVPETHRYEFTASELVAVAQRYPYAGAANAQVDLCVIDLRTRALRAIDYRHRAGRLPRASERRGGLGRGAGSKPRSTDADADAHSRSTAARRANC